tara:strand:- start:492 stop:1019 length:528 start_codon:yes stop_codon:yes gene_type:complete
MTPITKIFVDMDGVLADFVRGVEGPKYLNGPLVSEQTYDDRKIELSNKGLFRDLPTMPGMSDLLKYIKKSGIDWEILTASGSLNRTKVANDKIYWIRKHVDPEVIVTATIKGEDKAAFARSNHILIDDRKSNIRAWEEAGGIGILYRGVNGAIEQLNDVFYKMGKACLVARNTTK